MQHLEDLFYYTKWKFLIHGIFCYIMKKAVRYVAINMLKNKFN